MAKKAAAGGLLSALIVLVLAASLLFRFNKLGLLVIASFIMSIGLFTAGRTTALISYIASSVLYILTVGFTETALAYTLFFGLYPILRSLTEKFNKFQRILINIIMGNALVFAAFFIYRSLFVPEVVFEPVFLIAAGIALQVGLIVYELLINRIIYTAVYRLKLNRFINGGSNK